MERYIDFFPGHNASLKPNILLFSNGPAISRSFPDITHIKVNNGRKSAIFNLIKLKFSGLSLPETGHVP